MEIWHLLIDTTEKASRYAPKEFIYDKKAPHQANKPLFDPILIQTFDVIKVHNGEYLAQSQKICPLKLRWNSCHFVNSIFKCIFLNKLYDFRLRFH